MSTHTLHPLAVDYLERLEHAAARADLPQARGHELAAEIELHLRDAIPAEASEADVLTALDRLGTPEEIVAAEQPSPAPERDVRGTHEWAAIILVLLGGFVFGVGWIAGIILLWSSRCWRTREKWIGTLIIPGGLAASIYVALFVAMIGTGETCVGGSGVKTVCTGGPSTLSTVLVIVALIALLLAPIATAIFLAKRAKRAQPR